MLSRDWGDGHAAYPFISLKWQPWNITRHSVLRMPLKEQAYLVSYNPDLVWLGTFKTVCFSGAYTYRILAPEKKA